MTDNMLSKISKVLNQAENAATPEEADAFFTMAQNLSTRYSVSLAEARQAIQKSQRRESPERREEEIGFGNRNAKKPLVNLYSAISSANDVRLDVSRDGSKVFPYGFTSDLDVVEAMFAVLAPQMIQEANAFIESGEYKNEIVRKWSDKDWAYVDKPIDGRVARSNFYTAFVSKIRERLTKAKAETLVEIESETGSGAELVLADKVAEVSSYYEKTSNARGSYNSGGSKQYSSSGYGAGTTAGSRAKISGQGAVSGGKRSINA